MVRNADTHFGPSSVTSTLTVNGLDLVKLVLPEVLWTAVQPIFYVLSLFEPVYYGFRIDFLDR